MAVNKPPGGVYQINSSSAVGSHLVNTGWTDGQRQPIYQVGRSFLTEAEARRRGIIDQPKKGSAPVCMPLNLGKLGR